MYGVIGKWKKETERVLDLKTIIICKRNQIVKYGRMVNVKTVDLCSEQVQLSDLDSLVNKHPYDPQ